MTNPIDLCTLADVRNWLNTQPGGVASGRILTPGAGYSAITITAVSVDGNGSGATFTGTLLAGALTVITKTAPGTGYTQPPVLNITGTGGSGATAECYLEGDLKLASLITRASQMFLSLSGRTSFGSTTTTERRNGNGQPIMCPYWWPILSVASLTINGVTIPPSPNGTQAGWINDANRVMLVGGSGFPLVPAMTPYTFWNGYQNVLLNYTYGWTSIPFDVTQAVIELVAQKYRRSQHVDQISQALPAGGGTVTFSQKDVPDEVRSIVNNYRIKAIIE